jgi:hypothetical protein
MASARRQCSPSSPVPVDVAWDRDGSFEPQIVRKRQRRLDRIDEIVLSLTARGLTTGAVRNKFWHSCRIGQGPCPRRRKWSDYSRCPVGCEHERQVRPQPVGRWEGAAG